MDNVNKWVLDVQSKTPIYMQIKELVQKMILEGELPRNSKLSQRAIAQLLNVSKTPVNEAFDILASEGFITIKPNSGAVVTNNRWAFLNNNKTSFWENLITKGRYKNMPSGLSNIFRKLEGPPSTKILGDKIAVAFHPEKPLIEAMAKVSERLSSRPDDLNYFSCTGLYSLKETLTKHLKRYGITTQTENILITQGIGESLNLISWGLLDHGVTFICEKPSFINSIMIVQTTGVNIETVPYDDKGYNINKLSQKIKNVPNPILYAQLTNHSPTGVHASKENRNSILSICNEQNTPIIENDMFRDFVFDKKYPRPLKAFDKNDHIIYVGSLWSGFMGYKTSWIVAPPFIIERLKYIKTCLEFVSNTFVEMITDEMLTSGSYYEYMNELSPKILEQYLLIDHLLEKHLSGLVRWKRNNPAFFIWLEFASDVNIVKLHQQTDFNLLFQGNMYDWEDTNHARINVLGVEPEMAETLIIKIKKLITK